MDGGIHRSKESQEYDEGRKAELNGWGIKVIRFTNEEVEDSIDEVLTQIDVICKQRKIELLKPISEKI